MDKSIEEYWNDILQMGTDMHRLKFHSKLMTLYSGLEYSFTLKEILVLLQSSYSVVAIYKLTNNVPIARGLVGDVQCILVVFLKDLYKASTSNMDNLEVATWELLSIMQFKDMMDSNNLNDSDQNYNNILERLAIYSKNGNKYPCSYLLMFQRVLLDQYPFSDFDEWIKFATLLKDGKIKNCDDHPDKNKIQMYTNILLSIYDPEVDEIKGLTSFNHLLIALMIPVLTSEDRLLNYKVTTMAMNKISDCVSIISRNVVWVEYANDCLCNTLKNYRENDKDLDNILTKLTYMHVYEMTNSDSGFYTEYRNENGQIDENKLRMTVTIGLDNIDNNFDLSSKRVDIIKRTIYVLKQYVTALEDPETIKYTMNLQYLQIVEYYNELMRTYKWLAELYGILCTDSNNQSSIIKYQKGLESSLTMAIMIQRQYSFEDDHLEFLFYKKICKDSQLSYSWERQYKADGWIQKSPNNSVGRSHGSIFHEGHNCLQVSKFLNIDNPFIHQADVNILIFRDLMKEHSYDDSISIFVKNALTHFVVTSEDRVRNLQAHDLFSMYFVWRNYRLAKEEENK